MGGASGSGLAGNALGDMLSDGPGRTGGSGSAKAMLDQLVERMEQNLAEGAATMEAVTTGLGPARVAAMQNAR